MTQNACTAPGFLDTASDRHHAGTRARKTGPFRGCEIAWSAVLAPRPPRFATQAETRTAVLDFIEGSTTPIDSALDYDSPISHEKRHQAVA